MVKGKVVIIIPTFNREEFVQKAIDTSLEQSYPCQIIVCDHGSTDNTPKMMEKYKDRVTYIRREKDFGPHFCWLEAVLNADAEFIHIQFDDDWIEKDFIEKTIALMSDDVGFAVTEAQSFEQASGEKAGLCFDFKKRKLSAGVQSNKKIKKILLDGVMISPGACLFRKKDVLDALYQGNLPILEEQCYHGVGPDHFMSLICLLRYSKVAIIHEPLAVFRAHEGSITVDATHDIQKHLRIEKAYDAVRIYYQLLDFYNKNKLLQIIFNKRFLKKKFVWMYKTFFKKIGLRRKEVKPV